MGIVSWLRRPGHSSSRPEPSPAGGHTASCRPASLFDSFDRSPARAVAGVVARLLPRGLAAALLALLLLPGLAAPAAAQTPTANADGSYSVPLNWPLKPAGVPVGGKFRLLLITDTWRDASSTSISTYDSHVQSQVGSGHTVIRPYSGQFKVVGSTSAVDARDHVGATGTGVPIYWMGGSKVADDYADFWDGSWDANAPADRRNSNGQASNSNTQTDWSWTGSNDNGTKSSNPLGSATPTRGAFGSDDPIEHHVGSPNSQSHAFYGLSPVFRAGEYPKVSFNHSDTPTAEGRVLQIVAQSDQALNSDLTVSYTLTGTATAGTDYTISSGADYSTGTGTFTLPSGTAARTNVAVITLTIAVDSVTDSGETITFTIADGADYDPGDTPGFTYTVAENGGDAAFSITGTHRVGQTLRVSKTADDPDGNGGFSYSWEAEDPSRPHVWKAISGATGQEYTVTLGVEHNRLRAVVGYTDGAGLATTVQTTPISPAPIPGLRFDRTHLSWNESAGCGNLRYYGPGGEITASGGMAAWERARALAFSTTSGVSTSVRIDGNAPGPTYRVRLGSRPSAPVTVLVQDPNDIIHWKNLYEKNSRVFVDDNTNYGKPNNNYVDWRGTRLDFTPSNWNQWRTVRAKVACTSHYRDAVPIEHRIVRSDDKADYPVRRKTWKVWVSVNEADPPMEVLDLPQAGQEITVSEGSDRDFRIRISPDLLPDGTNSRVEVSIRTRNDSVMTAGRRDGSARRAGIFQDRMVFTPTSREQWVRLRGVSASAAVSCGRNNPCHVPGTTELEVRTGGLLWGDQSTRKTWELTWPVTVTPPGMGAPPAGVPTEAVANLQISATDATSAGVTWDAVEHATSYDVSWDLAGEDGQSAGGGSESVTGTSATIRHDATTAMTLTVRVTPEHLDGNGETQRLDALAVTAELAVGPGTTEAGAGQGADALGDGPQGHEAEILNGSVTVDVPADWTGRGRPQVSGGAHRLSGWSGLGFDFQGLGSPPGTLTVSWSSRPAGAVTLPLEWQPVAGADWRHSDGGPIGLFEVAIVDPVPEQPQQPTPTPEVTVSGGGGVTEGTAASFTVTANPAPASPVEVTLTVGQDGDFAVSGETGTRTVTVPTSGSVAVDIPTVDDGKDEPDGAITLTVDSCDGCTVGAASTTAVSVADNDEATLPELSLAAGAAVDEGTAAGFTVTASPAPQADVTVAYTVAQSGDVLAAPGAGSRTVVLAAGKTSVALAVATDDDAVNEADGSVTVTLDAGTGYTVAAGAGSGAVTVRDDDVPVVGVTAGSGVTEGTAASFTVTASPTPHAALDVALTVTQDGDFAASGETGARTVTVPTSGSVTVEVDTVDDGQDEPDGSVTATVDAGTGYTVAAAPANAASVEVADDDAAAGVPTVSVADVSGKESDRFLWFTVRLSRAVDRHVTVYMKTRDSTPVSAEALRDYIPYRNRTEYFRPGETEKRVPVYVFDDSHDEDPETFELVLTNVWTTRGGLDAVTIADGVAVGTIVNDDPMPAAWLARFGRTAAEQALDGIAGRMAAPRTPGLEATLAGQALGGGHAAQDAAGMTPTARRAARAEREAQLAMAELAREIVAERHGDGMDGGGSGFGHDGLGFGTGAGGPQSRSMTAKEAMLGTSFSLTGARDGSGGTLAFWGRAAQSHFDGREGTFSLDGEATTAMLGADYARGRWLAGLALMQTGGEGGYADTGSGPQGCPEGIDPEMAHLCNGAVREGDGRVEASLTAAIPYGAWQASERLRLWGALGHGTGEVTLKPEPGGSYRADIGWTMAAAGLRGDVIAPPAEGSGPALALTSDALWARTSSDRTHDLAASESDVTRLRLGLEGSWRVALEGGGTLVPKLEVGARHDGGDAETGFGVELGGGIAWTDPGMGLTLDLSGRTLLAHEDGDLKDRGYSASVSWDPAPETARGPSVSMRQAFGGEAEGGLDALFRADPLADRTGSEAASRWEAEAAWGFPAFSGRFTGSPHMGLGLAASSRDWSLGWRLTPEAGRAPDLSFGLKAERRESDGTVPEHAVGVEAVVRW